MIGVICNIITRTIRILMIDRTMSVASNAIRYHASLAFIASSVSVAFWNI